MNRGKDIIIKTKIKFEDIDMCSKCIMMFKKGLALEHCAIIKKIMEIEDIHGVEIAVFSCPDYKKHKR